ncbi:MAG: NFYB/HAP3 family transcription factor subunit [Candidatus Micrarchaeota archaeon]|nr:NFYB/HAP3 family transcription factor subunit [Candidatus Micrarchaeota archaeon]
MRISSGVAKKIIKEAGGKRVSNDAAQELADQINQFAYSVAKKACELAAHAKRETVKKEDVQLAK